MIKTVESAFEISRTEDITHYEFEHNNIPMENSLL